MKQLTNEERAALVEFLKFLVAGSAGQHKQIYEIALATLTAPKPELAGKFAFEGVGHRWHHIKRGEQQFTEPKLPLVNLYTAPPAPELITDESLRAAVRIWNRAEFPSPDVYDAMRAALARSVEDE